MRMMKEIDVFNFESHLDGLGSWSLPCVGELEGERGWVNVVSACMNSDVLCAV